MHFRITGLDGRPFRHLFGLSDDELARHRARRCIADVRPGYPDRIELRDAEPGEPLILLNYTHQPADTPFRSSHAIFVREHAAEVYDAVDAVPELLRLRTLSLRAFDADGMMVDAAVCAGTELEERIERLLSNPQGAYLHAHAAARGCYLARIERA